MPLAPSPDFTHGQGYGTPPLIPSLTTSYLVYLTRSEKSVHIGGPIDFESVCIAASETTEAVYDQQFGKVSMSYAYLPL